MSSYYVDGSICHRVMLMGVYMSSCYVDGGICHRVMLMGVYVIVLC